MHKKTYLNNGIRVITQNIPYVKSVSLGFWINTGSIFETIDNNGISHFIEHMLFKGTHSRTAKDIASHIDSIGGQLNAFTSKECTCYYAKVLDSHFDIAIDVLSDMLLNSKFDQIDIEKEKGVVYEEISMYDDSPEDLVYDVLSKTVFKEHSLGLPILGTHETISSLNRSDLINHIKTHYNSENIVISVVGSFNEDLLIETLNNSIGQSPLITKGNTNVNKPEFYSNLTFRSKDIEQVHLCISYEGIENKNKYFYSLLVLNNIFGGGMSSRLFQSIREDNGLAYSIYSHPSFYKETGLYTINVSLNPSQFERVTDLISNEIKTVTNIPITTEELRKSKEQLKGNYILGLESTNSIMTMLGKSEVFDQKIKTPEEIVKEINNVSIYDIEYIVNKIFNTKAVSMAVVGNINESLVEKNYLKIKNTI